MIVSPSLLAADFMNLEQELNKLETSNAEWIHLDIMDGSFVPNISFGFDIIKQARVLSSKFFDTHLMILNPINYVEKCSQIGCELFTFHYEACKDDDEIKKVIQKVKENNMQVGISVKPDTDIKVLDDFLDELDLVLIMSVNPGFGGQKFMQEQLEKVIYLDKLKKEKNFLIQIDGGINDTNIKSVKDAGVDVIVAGSYLFNEEMNSRIEGILNV